MEWFLMDLRWNTHIPLLLYLELHTTHEIVNARSFSEAAKKTVEPIWLDKLMTSVEGHYQGVCKLVRR